MTSPLRSWALTAMVLGAAFSRLIPHPPSFTPVLATALFGGALFASVRAAVGVPLLAMLLSDVALAMLVYGWGIFASVPAMYLGTVLTVFLGRLLQGRIKAWRVGGMAALAALAYFALTNFSVWLRGHLYPPTFDGLVACYVAAIPFLKNLLLGNLVFAGVLFGGFAWAEHRLPALRAPVREA